MSTLLILFKEAILVISEMIFNWKKSSQITIPENVDKNEDPKIDIYKSNLQGSRGQ